MRFGGFSLFQRTSSLRTINLASWHNPRSLTWSWILSLAREDVSRWGFFPYRTNDGLQWVLRAGVFSLHWLRQKPMWKEPTDAK